jgi:serine protease inhibitor
MGIQAAFNPKQADFSGISEEDLVVSDVLQSVSCGSRPPAARANPKLMLTCVMHASLPTHTQAVVQVDESGTEAAAVTSVVMVTTAFTPNATPPLVFDRPFLFFLVDDVTQAVLFQGVVTDPTKA